MVRGVEVIAPAVSSPSGDFDRDVVAVLGLPFDVCTVAQAATMVRTAASTRQRCFISTPNLNFAIAARSDAEFRNSVLRSDLCLADGMPIVRIARALGLPLRERVAGATLFEFLRASRQAPLSVFFFGGKEGVAAAACARLNASSEGLRCVGYDEAGHGSVEELGDDQTITRMNATGADFVIVSLGARKGQAWIERHASAMRAPVVSHLGAVINFVAGSVQRAPRWVQSLGLEWLWRIKEEPLLWRRYLNDGAGLIRLLFTRVLPLVAWRLLGVWDQAPASSSLTLDRGREAGGAETRILLQGSWTRAELGPLRQALNTCQHDGSTLVLSLHGITRIDSSFVGLMLIARGRFGPLGIRMVGATARVRRFLRLSGAEHLLDDLPVRPDRSAT